MESEPKPKRAYVKKAKVIDETSIVEVTEPKPKRTYTKKTKVIEETKKEIPFIVEETLPIIEEKLPIVEETPPIVEEKKPKRVYIKKSKIVQENNNVESINTQIDIIQKDLDNLKIDDDVIIENDNMQTIVSQTEVIQHQENKRKIDDNITYQYKKPSLYTYDIDIDLNLYIFDKFHDGSKKNKKSVLQISSFISMPIMDLEQYITKHFYIKSNNSNIKVCYLGNNFIFNKELIKSIGDYYIETKLYIDNNTHKMWFITHKFGMIHISLK
jgi:hypothetical protein